ncbi:C2H2-type domain-containing protein, variant 2 [Balamuthia mandrillaris]
MMRRSCVLERRPGRFGLAFVLAAAACVFLLCAEVPRCSAAPKTTEQAISCSGTQSRVVRDLLEEKVFPVIDQEDFELAPDCPLHPARDKLRTLEQHKRQRSRTKWKCKICRKSFSEEEYLYEHIKSAHLEELVEDGDVCLGDYFDLFRCQEEENEVQVSACNPITMEKLRFKCQNLMHKCFPTGESDVAHRLNGLFTRQFCDALTCNYVPDQVIVAQERGKMSVLGQILWWIFMVIVAACILIFYLLFWAQTRFDILFFFVFFC